MVEQWTFYMGTPKGNTLPFWGGTTIWDIETGPDESKTFRKI